MFGTMKSVDVSDVREHRERHEVHNRLLRMDRILHGNQSSRKSQKYKTKPKSMSNRQET